MAAATPPTSTLLRRRHLIGTPTTLTVATNNHPSSAAIAIATTSSSSSSSVDFELVSVKSSCYTSLRDILPSPTTTVYSPIAPSFTTYTGHQISIRNRLVKQAAWAYLQPMSASPESNRTTVLRRIWTQFSGAFLRLLNRLLRSIHIGINTSTS